MVGADRHSFHCLTVTLVCGKHTAINPRKTNYKTSKEDTAVHGQPEEHPGFLRARVCVCVWVAGRRCSRHKQVPAGVGHAAAGGGRGVPIVATAPTQQAQEGEGQDEKHQAAECNAARPPVGGHMLRLLTQQRREAAFITDDFKYLWL